MTGLARPHPAVGIAESGIGRVAVIGAGVMGGGIAAQFANAGLSVDLLDIPSTDTTSSRIGPALAGIDRQIKANGFMSRGAADLVRPGNIEDDIGRLADVDWVVEAVVERLDVKLDLYRRIDAVRQPGTIVSSNTSTIPRAQLVEGMGAAFASDFLITHFFNPPRMMRLVELVTAPDNDPALVARARSACDVVLGKTVVDCRDTPGFIANRIGCYWLAVGILEALRLGLTPEEADTIMGAFGVPKTGVFGLIDLVGIDLVPQVWGSLMTSLPASDGLNKHDLPGAPVIVDHIAAGRFGRKAKAGFYRRGADKSIETFDVATGDYRKARPLSAGDLPGKGRDLATLIDAGGKYGDYAASVLSHVIAYAANHGPEIAADVDAIDTAMALGYGWRQGPFRLADAFGTERLAQDLRGDGRDVPRLLDQAAEAGGFYQASGTVLGTEGAQVAPSRPQGLVTLSNARSSGAPIAGNDAASLWDIGDGVACLEVHTKLNALSGEVFDVIEQTLDRAGTDFQAIVLGNEDPRAFSAGADLSQIVGYIKGDDLAGLDAFIARGQKLFRAMKYGKVPVVAAMHGLALGGGCEIGLHAHAIVAHAEFYGGLPEVLVGLIPGWGGCTQLLLRAQEASGAPKGPVAPAMRVFETILYAKRSASAHDARAMGILRDGDDVVMNRDRLLAAAKARALDLAERGWRSPEPAAVMVAGPSGKAAMMNAVFGLQSRGLASETDMAIADALAEVLAGGPDGDLTRHASEADIMELERAALIALAGRPATQARISHMLETGKPLRN